MTLLNQTAQAVHVSDAGLGVTGLGRVGEQGCRSGMVGRSVAGGGFRKSGADPHDPANLGRRRIAAMRPNAVSVIGSALTPHREKP